MTDPSPAVPGLTARVQPQYWDGDYAVNTGAAVEFEVGGLLAAMPEGERTRALQNIVAGAPDLDFLYFAAVEAGLAPEGFGPFYVQVDAYDAVRWVQSARWSGRTCLMCEGSGKYARPVFEPFDDDTGARPLTRYEETALPCGACNGHGREPAETDLLFDPPIPTSLP